jgi:hypothetical protein
MENTKLRFYVNEALLFGRKWEIIFNFGGDLGSDPAENT